MTIITHSRVDAQENHVSTATQTNQASIRAQFPELEVPANSPPPSVTSVTDTLPKGGRKGNRPEEELGGVTNKVGDALPSTGLTMPNETKGGSEGKEGRLNIKIHLSLYAKVRLDLDAQIYGDIVIGLL
ncbi:uncharacterized protein N7477_009438 [Penicillium maclennaniae]|uniref:uncharacterized protein n=1 Tax=Penicillium maclennaniae TaxID=1343394 RepID=UPI00254076F3|nr:uncharacterized protein N7477_009438 [Penicillium maclennaniae]KAJ5661822.1 hypothetical protein N7477_009438 [Penicillium maclennaniae]